MLSGQGTASRSCSRPTRSASQGRRSWRGSGSRPRCTRRSPRCTTWARIGHGQPLSTGFCWTQPDTPRGPCDLIQPGHRAFGVVDMGAPGGIRTHTAALLRDLPLPVGLRGRSPRVTVPPGGGSRTRSVDAVHRAAGALLSRGRVCTDGHGREPTLRRSRSMSLLSVSSPRAALPTTRTLSAPLSLKAPSGRLFGCHAARLP